MKPLSPTLLSSFIVIAALLVTNVAEVDENSRPNVLIFFVDDMGWMDSSAYGSQVSPIGIGTGTPAADRIFSGDSRAGFGTALCRGC